MNLQSFFGKQTSNHVPNIKPCMASNLISQIESASILHEYNDRHIIIKCTIKDLLKMPIQNWKFNRPPDSIRTNEIALSIYNQKKAFDTMIYIDYNTNHNEYNVIDGIHRITALRKIYRENSKPPDYLTGEFGSNGDAEWLYNSYIILNIRLNHSDGELIDLFHSLNKCVPVPELYINTRDEDKTKIIESLVKNWARRYKTHFSSNQKPNRPNINRDSFIDILSEIYDKYNFNSGSQKEFNELIENANIHISNNLPKKLTSHILHKCNLSGCYLFVENKEYIMNVIDKINPSI